MLNQHPFLSVLLLCLWYVGYKNIGKIVETSTVEESTIEVDEKEIEAAASAVMTADKVIVKSKNGEKRLVKNRNGTIESVSEKTKAAVDCRLF